MKPEITVSTITISGNVMADGANLPGATVSLSGTLAQTTTTDADGSYTLTANAGGNYAVSVYKNGFKFDPASQTFTNLQANQIANFQNGVPLCAPAASGLVSWYQGEGNLLDSVGSNNGTASASGVGFPLDGKVGRSLGFTGANQQSVNVPDNVSLKPSTLTVSGWFKITQAPTSEDFVLVSKYGGDYRGWILAVNTNRSATFSVHRPNTIETAVSSVNSIPLNVWTHIAATYEGYNAAIYINGVLQSSVYFNGGYEATTNIMRIGSASWYNGSFTTGQIDETQIYNRALSASEIQTIYNAGGAGNCTDAVMPSSTGIPDTSFGTGGKVITPVGNSNDRAYSIAIQPDGKIVAAGYSYSSSNNDFAVVRYNTDGTLDTSFGGTGKVVTPVGNSTDRAYSIAIQPDGKIVAAGYSSRGSNDDFALVRYNTDGTLDTSFGTSGKVITPVGNSTDVVTSVAIQPDGKIVAAGYSSSSSTYDFALVRYNTDGTLDTSFGTGGKVVTPVGNSNDEAFSVAMQADGKIVAAGYSYSSSNDDFALVRYNTDGTLDTSFGGTGKVVTPVGNSDDEALSVAIQADGKIVAAGYSIGSTYDFALVRYNTDGTLDTSFGTSGKVITPVGNSDDGEYSIAIQPDGKIVAAGYSYNSSTYDFALVRYNTDGTLDTSFGTGGKVVTPVGNSTDVVTSVAMQADGKIVATGYSIGSTYDFALVRYGFGKNGQGDLPLVNGAFIKFASVTRAGSSIATLLTASQIPALPTGYTLPANAPMYDIRTSAGYSGNITVTFNVPNIADAATCSNLISLHFENGAWTSSTNAAPTYNAGTQVCTVAQTVTSLSPFVVALQSPTSFTYEADVQNRPSGDGFVDADDIQQIRNFVVGNGFPYQSNEFQRADCSPRSTLGDGFVDSDDVQQARRFSVGTDTNQLAGGPTSAMPPPVEFGQAEEAINSPFGKSTAPNFGSLSAGSAAFRVDDQTTNAGQKLVVPIRVDAAGNEAGYTFSLGYDAAMLTDPQISIGTAGGDVVFNTQTAGQIGFSVTSFSGETIAPGTNRVLVNVTFKVANTSTGTTAVSFTDTLARRKTSGIDPNTPLRQPNYTNGVVTINGTTILGATVGGRVLTQSGRGIRNVMVTLTDARGNARTAMTTSFGYYEFKDVPPGENYTIEARAKRYKFGQPMQIRNITGDIDDVIFTADSW